MSRRQLITMSGSEIADFLNQERVVTCATLGTGGLPHLLPMWYSPDGTTVNCWTYATSQKVINLRRRAQATLQVEAGNSYEELRGVMMECDAVIVEDAQQVTQTGLAIARRYLPPGSPRSSQTLTDLAEFVERQAARRVALRFTPTRIVSWNHAKLAGAY